MQDGMQHESLFLSYHLSFETMTTCVLHVFLAIQCVE